MERYRAFEFKELGTADLFVDALYRGGRRGHAGDDAISKLMRCGNQGGFRYTGSVSNRVNLCVLYSSFSDLDWPDRLDPEMGIFIYYGDNKNPGHDLHDTHGKGNLILKQSFSALHVGKRESIPPFFVFTKGPHGRDVFFRGLAVPGARGISALDDLVAVWKTKEGQRFQNYRAVFTILDLPRIDHAWLDDLHRENPLSENAPEKWLEWANGGDYQPLAAPRSVAYRTRVEQIPPEGRKRQIVQTVINYFKAHEKGEYAFERCAAEIAVLMDQHITEYDLTRPWRDGGRDVIGKYRIGSPQNAIDVEFALEAKCKQFGNGSGVRETSRLISRLRYRQFGIFVTTSYVSEQAYKEIVEDSHPVIVVSGADIANILLEAGYNTKKVVLAWLQREFPSS